MVEQNVEDIRLVFMIDGLELTVTHMEFKKTNYKISAHVDRLMILKK